MNENYGPYTMVSHCKELVVNGKPVIAIIYGAYNAYGLIGSEMNGIALFGMVGGQRVLLADGICPQASGYYGPSAEQLRIFSSLERMTAQEIAALAKNKGR